MTTYTKAQIAEITARYEAANQKKAEMERRAENEDVPVEEEDAVEQEFITAQREYQIATGWKK